MRIVERDRQLTLSEGRIGSAAAALVTFACGAPTFLVGLTTLRISQSLLSNVLWILVGAAVIAVSAMLAWNAFYDQRWTFDLRAADACFTVRNGYIIGETRQIERVEVTRLAGRLYEVNVLHAGRVYCVMTTTVADEAKTLAARLAKFLDRPLT